MIRPMLIAATWALMSVSPPVAAQTAPATPQAAAPGTEAWLRSRGETYSAAPDSEQDPAEVAETARLNAGITARNAAAERAEAESAALFDQQSAQWREDAARVETQRAQYEADLAAATAARAAYDRARAAWEAEVAACERARRVCVTTPPKA